MYERTECFRKEIMSDDTHKFRIIPIVENFYLTDMPEEGHLDVICARLMRLSYAEYLRFCRDVLGADCKMYNGFPIAIFPKNDLTHQFVRNLNARANLVLWERNHPDWKEHERIMKRSKLNGNN